MNFESLCCFMSRNFSELNVVECLHLPAHFSLRESEDDFFAPAKRFWLLCRLVLPLARSFAVGVWRSFSSASA